MEKARRDNLRRVVYKCRQIFEEEFAKRAIYYGCLQDGQFTDVSTLGHLTFQDIQTRKKLEQAIAKERLGGLDQKAALHRYIEHVGFTFLNRFAALRAMEARGLIKETIPRRDQYGGRSLRERDIWETNPALTSEQVVHLSLVEAFAEVGKEIRVLFENESEYALLFPGANASLRAMALLSEDVTEEDWKEDDVIGWIYQYYNDEAREKFRKAKRKPQADDIPVINQFYTPDWIVKALVDNTLGRLWLDTRPNSKLKSYCTYLIETGRTSNSEVKPLRQIKILDPACGSGHFLSYAFDLLYQMYIEEEPRTPLSEIPSLILEHNLYGIDIDLRAVQLSALSLYLKGKKYNSSLKIRKMNLVCADIRISDGTKRADFLENFKDDEALQHIFEKLFSSLNSTFEIGSLLKVRPLFEALFDERKQTPSEKQAVFAVALTGQTELATGRVRGQASFPYKSREGPGGSVTTVVVPKERTIEDMLEQLRRFEQEASQDQDMGRLLFATEAEKSVGLLALLSQRYDIVLMNPPYGDMPDITKKYLREYYPETHHDYYAAFMEQAVDLTGPAGYIGALVGRTFMFLRWFQWIREVLFRERAPPQVIMDLGYGVLDVAAARWAAYVARKTSPADDERVMKQDIDFVRLTKGRDESRKKPAWEEAVDALNSGNHHPLVYKATIRELSTIPGTPFSYWASNSLRSLFERYPPLDRDVARRPGQLKIADVKVGLQTGDDARFSRMWWEVPAESIATCKEETFQGKKWVPLANHAYLLYFFGDVRVVVDWNNAGEVFERSKGAVVRNDEFYFHSGLAWSARTSRSQMPKLRQIQRIPFRVLPAGSIFGTTGQAAMVEGEVWVILALCCSKLLYYLSRLISLDRMTTSTPASLPIALPSDNAGVSRLAGLAKEAYDLLRERDIGDELSTIFIKPWILQVLRGMATHDKPITKHPFANSFEWSTWESTEKIRSAAVGKPVTLQALVKLCLEKERILQGRLNYLQREIDEVAYQLYEVSGAARLAIEGELSLEAGEDGGDSRAKQSVLDSNDRSVEDHITRLFSYYGKLIIESAEDGIVPLEPTFPRNLLQEIRRHLSSDFGTQAEIIEKEFEDILGVSLSEWLETRLFDYYVSLYRGRPIYWQLTSSQFGHKREKPVFSCFVYYHKLTRDTIAKVRGFYVKRTKEQLSLEIERLKRELLTAKQDLDKNKIDRLSKDYEDALVRIEELEKFDQGLERVSSPRSPTDLKNLSTKWVERAISEVRNDGWTPNPDYGVLVNITPLREVQLLHPAASRVK
jgi:SAM-dependent methyltransferase